MNALELAHDDPDAAHALPVDAYADQLELARLARRLKELEAKVAQLEGDLRIANARPISTPYPGVLPPVTYPGPWVAPMPVWNTPHIGDFPGMAPTITCTNKAAVGSEVPVSAIDGSVHYTETDRSHWSDFMPGQTTP